MGSRKTEKPIDKDKKDHKSTTSTPENDQTRLQAAITNVERSTTSLEIQHDRLTTSEPVVKNHRRGWLIPVTINQVSSMTLLDTGGICTMIGRPLYDTLQATKPLTVKQDEELRLKVVGGGPYPRNS